ncbi:hypothetical protein GGR56DRAFT_673339 [Xylariaceae sp. FL0804]|nr:hypothetical protein GGR56DRAFT_673339 [Xylariaceae sp. FL0804]
MEQLEEISEPRGLSFQPDFITREHEQELLRIFRHELEWPDKSGSGSGSSRPGAAARRSLHYGYTFDYKTFGVDPAVPYRDFPAWLRPLVPRVDDDEGGEGEGRGPPEQVCLQHYPPGAGIPPHVDTHSAYDQLYALSLGAPVVMQFRRRHRHRPLGSGGGSGGGDDDDDGQQQQQQQRVEEVEVDLAPRSMMRMAGDARLHWTHGIRKRKTDVRPGGDGSVVRPRADRWSITFRWLRAGGECECGDEALCDTAQRRAGVEREYRWKQQQQQQQQQQQGQEHQVVVPADEAQEAALPTATGTE